MNANLAFVITLLFMFLDIIFYQQFSIVQVVTLYYVLLLTFKYQDKENDETIINF